MELDLDMDLLDMDLMLDLPDLFTKVPILDLRDFIFDVGLFLGLGLKLMGSCMRRI